MLQLVFFSRFEGKWQSSLGIFSQILVLTKNKEKTFVIFSFVTLWKPNK
jgi:hypothetical protein